MDRRRPGTNMSNQRDRRDGQPAARLEKIKEIGSPGNKFSK